MTRMESDLPPQQAEDRPHRAADDREEVYFEGSPLLRGEVGKLLLCVVIGIALIATPFIYRAFSAAWPHWIVTIILVLIGLAVLAIPWLIVKSIRYRISNYRIDYERGILSKNIDTLELWHVDDIKFRQSLLDRMLGVGTITVFSDDETTPNLALQGLPNPRPVFDALKQRIIAVKRQRGVIKMDMG